MLFEFLSNFLPEKSPIIKRKNPHKIDPEKCVDDFWPLPEILPDGRKSDALLISNNKLAFIGDKSQTSLALATLVKDFSIKFPNSDVIIISADESSSLKGDNNSQMDPVTILPNGSRIISFGFGKNAILDSMSLIYSEAKKREALSSAIIKNSSYSRQGDYALLHSMWDGKAGVAPILVVFSGMEKVLDEIEYEKYHSRPNTAGNRIFSLINQSYYKLGMFVAASFDEPLDKISSESFYGTYKIKTSFSSIFMKHSTFDKDFVGREELGTDLNNIPSGIGLGYFPKTVLDYGSKFIPRELALNSDLKKVSNKKKKNSFEVTLSEAFYMVTREARESLSTIQTWPINFENLLLPSGGILDHVEESKRIDAVLCLLGTQNPILQRSFVTEVFSKQLSSSQKIKDVANKNKKFKAFFDFFTNLDKDPRFMSNSFIRMEDFGMEILKKELVPNKKSKEDYIILHNFVEDNFVQCFEKNWPEIALFSEFIAVTFSYEPTHFSNYIANVEGLKALERNGSMEGRQIPFLSSELRSFEDIENIFDEESYLNRSTFVGKLTKAEKQIYVDAFKAEKERQLTVLRDIFYKHKNQMAENPRY